jgi:serine/threonine protein kinase
MFSLYFFFLIKDLKPENILVQTEDNTLKLIDFGSAKRLKDGEPNIAYVVSRFYRYTLPLSLSLSLLKY